MFIGIHKQEHQHPLGSGVKASLVVKSSSATFRYLYPLKFHLDALVTPPHLHYTWCILWAFHKGLKSLTVARPPLAQG